MFGGGGDDGTYDESFRLTKPPGHSFRMLGRPFSADAVHRVVADHHLLRVFRRHHQYGPDRPHIGPEAPTAYGPRRRVPAPQIPGQRLRPER